MRALYRKMNERIRPDAALIDGLLHRSRPRTGQRAALALCCLIVLCLGMPALAANLPATYPLLYALSPATAQRFKPVNEACEDQGIRMEVLAAHAEGDSAQVLIALTDLTGDRLDETCDLFDSYAIRVTGGLEGSCSLAQYDEETRTAQLLVSLTRADGKRISREKVTFSVETLLCGKQTFEQPLENIWQALSGEAQTMLPGERLRSGEGQKAALVPAAQEVELTGGVCLSALAEVNGRLHVQLHFASVERDDHGYVWLEDEMGNRIEDDDSFSFYDGAGGYYQEQVFSLDDNAYSACTMHGDFVTCATRIDGDWEVTFKIG